MPAVIHELARRFDAIKFDARDFEFWLAVGDYIKFIELCPELKNILDDSEKKYRHAHGIIMDRHWEDSKKIETSGPNYGKAAFQNKVNQRAIEIGKIEAMNIYCRFVLPWIIQLALYEMANKHELHREDAHKCVGHENMHDLSVDAMKYEKELNEIRLKKISKSNELIQLGDTVYADVRFVHREMVNQIIANEIAMGDSENDASSPEIQPVTEVRQSTVILEKESGHVLDENILKKFARATAWEQVRLEFSGDGSSVEVFIQEETAGMFHFDKLGFQKQSSVESKPIKSWQMMRLLAMSAGSIPCTKENQQTKKDLGNKLRTLFPTLNGDPILHDKESNTYRGTVKFIDKMDERSAYLGIGKSYLKQV